MSRDDGVEAADEVTLKTGVSDWWTVHRGDCPIIGTAIHNGHGVRASLAEAMAIGAEQRLREEDPFTEFTIRDVANRTVVHRSRFEVDINRPRAEAVYLTPEQAWGLDIWAKTPPADMVEESLALYDSYYAMLESLLRDIERRHGRFVLLDIHSYNHRRDGADAPATDPQGAPEINIGTFSMDRAKWAHVVDPFIDALRAFDFMGRRLDVRENVAFQGKGAQTRFVHETFPEAGCAIAVEFKKFFMDEWTGAPDGQALEAMRALIASTLPLLEELIGARR